jgi:hypothetical protein
VVVVVATSHPKANPSPSPWSHKSTRTLAAPASTPNGTFTPRLSDTRSAATRTRKRKKSNRRARPTPSQTSRATTRSSAGREALLALTLRASSASTRAVEVMRDDCFARKGRLSVRRMERGLRIRDCLGVVVRGSSFIRLFIVIFKDGGRDGGI